MRTEYARIRLMWYIRLLTTRAVTRWSGVPDSPLYLCFAVVLGTLTAGSILGWHNVDPRNLGWIHADPSIYQAGWEFLRHSRRIFPPTWIDDLNYPFGISAAYLDVIPLVAIPLRLASNILPDNFQYLGLFAVACFVLQAWFGFKLASRFTNDRFVIFCGGMFFLESPILLTRLYGQFSLSSQWLILAAFYYYFQPLAGKTLFRYVVPFAALVVIAGGITPYLAVMVLAIGACALGRNCLDTVRSGIATPTELQPDGRRAVLRLVAGRVSWAIGLAGLMAASMAFFGFITLGQGSQFAGGGYTVYSMNLVSPFSPLPFYGYLPTLPGQGFAGYNYLGLGVLCLLFVVVIRHPARLKELGNSSLLPLVCLSLILTVLALSVRISFGSAVLFTIPVPRFLFQWLSVFRSSGRFFWPVHDLLLLGAIVGATSLFRARWMSRAALAAALLLQLYDTAPIRNGVAAQYRIAYPDPLTAAVWATIPKSSRHLVILPAAQCVPWLGPERDPAWPWFARLAARSGMTLNSTHSARPSAASKAFNCSRLPEILMRDGPARDTAYVLNDQYALRLLDRFRRTHYCRRVDGLNLCTYDPARAPLSRLLVRKLLPP
ncbi:MAG: DUF6311 domain-containing protein [Acidobacteriaceae bacterium]